MCVSKLEMYMRASGSGIRRMGLASKHGLRMVLSTKDSGRMINRMALESIKRLMAILLRASGSSEELTE